MSIVSVERYGYMEEKVSSKIFMWFMIEFINKGKFIRNMCVYRVYWGVLIIIIKL